MAAEYHYTEIFRSLQGEGTYTGINTAWLRLFVCNLQCKGFGQPDPTDPSTYKPVGFDIDISNITKYADVPIFEYGCDSAYSIAKKYKHLTFKETADTIAEKLTDLLRNEYNPDGLFWNPKTGQETHMAFTGGEPLLKFNQNAIIDVMNCLDERNNQPKFVTVETNGTQPITDDLEQFIDNFIFKGEREWFWSSSPKLWSTSGERWDRAIKPQNLRQYADISNHGHLKYVVNGTERSWNEVEEATNLFRNEGVDWPVYIMPVGATKESQEQPIISEICDEALARGYNVSGRLHCNIYGNEIGK